MTAETQAIKLLLIEDNPADAALIQEVLSSGNAFKITSASYLKDGLKHLHSGQPDVVLLDLSLPDSRGLDTLTKVSSEAPHMPIIILTGSSDEALAVKALHLGAQDYLVKGPIEGPLLSRLIRYAIERKKNEETLRKSAEDLAHSNEQLENFSRELQNANQQLKALDEAKSKFITIASHELKTPLAAMIGFLSLVLNGKMGAVNQEVLGVLNHVKTSSDRLLRLVDDLLDLSRIELGQMTMAKVNADLQLILKEEAAAFEVQAKEHAITLEIQVPGDLKQVSCDKDRMRQVFDNLISNAIKYTPKKGAVRIEAKNTGTGVQIDFKDTGIGVAKGDEERVFEPFLHIHETGVHGEKSSGMGLAVVRKIIEAHGGKVTLTSEVGKGSVFSVVLPSAGSDGNVRSAAA